MRFSLKHNKQWEHYNVCRVCKSFENSGELTQMKYRKKRMSLLLTQYAATAISSASLSSPRNPQNDIAFAFLVTQLLRYINKLL